MDTKYILVLAAVLILGWFAFGIIYNLRHGEALLRWMQGGLPQVGEKTTMRWLGSSVAEMIIAKAKSPIRRLETLLVLVPRDVPWMWLLASLQGRRDTLIFRVQLGSSPQVDCELVDTHSWTGRMAEQQAVRQGWESQPYREYLLFAPRGMLPLAQATLEQLDAPAQALAAHYRRFALRRTTPHLEVHLPFPRPRQDDAGEFFRSLIALARALGEKS